MKKSGAKLRQKPQKGKKIVDLAAEICIIFNENTVAIFQNEKLPYQNERVFIDSYVPIVAISILLLGANAACCLWHIFCTSYFNRGMSMREDRNRTTVQNRTHNALSQD